MKEEKRFQNRGVVPIATRHCYPLMLSYVKPAALDPLWINNDVLSKPHHWVKMGDVKLTLSHQVFLPIYNTPFKIKKGPQIFRCVYNRDDIQLYFKLTASNLSKNKAKF